MLQLSWNKNSPDSKNHPEIKTIKEKKQPTPHPSHVFAFMWLTNPESKIDSCLLLTLKARLIREECLCSSWIEQYVMFLYEPINKNRKLSWCNPVVKCAGHFCPCPLDFVIVHVISDRICNWVITLMCDLVHVIAFVFHTLLAVICGLTFKLYLNQLMWQKCFGNYG